MITDRFFVARAAAALLGLGLVSGVAQAQQTIPQPTVQQPTAQAVVPQDLSREGEALRAALAARLGAGSTAMGTYAARGFAPIWLDASGRPTDAATVLVDFLRRADEHALPAARYHGDALAAELGRGAGGPALEADLTAAFLAYAGDIGSGVLDPGEVDRNLHIDVPVRDPGVLLSGAASSRNIAAYLDGLAPSDPNYRRLVERYRSFRSIAGGEIWGPRVSPGPTLRPGDRGQRVAEARARLTAMGDLDPNVYGHVASDGARLALAGTADVAAPGYDPAYYDEQMEQAVRRFQERVGLNPDGLIGPATLSQLNVSPRDRVAQIAVNLERLRWLNRDIGERYILVNLAGFEMQVIEDGRPVFESRVIAGQSDDWQTPEFSQTMTHLVVNPSWYVPMSIAKQEILPKLKQDPTYLAKQGMRLIGAEAEQIDWSTVTPATFPGRITQLPGEGNALGNVKFMFPNRYSVYLHDTPTRNLFQHDIRDFSHGCIRVEKAHELAEYLLSGQVPNPGAYYDRVVADGDEHRVELERPLPVVITYRTAWIDASGREQFRGDVYGRDRTVANALRAAGVQILG